MIKQFGEDNRKQDVFPSKGTGGFVNAAVLMSSVSCRYIASSCLWESVGWMNSLYCGLVCMLLLFFGNQRAEWIQLLYCCSVCMLLLLFSRYVEADSLGPCGSQPARLPCPTLSPGVRPNACPSSRWCYWIVSSSAAPSPSAFSPSQYQGIFSNE